MREIKFRAWDKKGKGMVDPAILWLKLNGAELTHISLEKKDFGIFDFREQVELMQFTGLKDKNGKEIYEGDIVREFRVPLGCGSQEKWDELSKEVRRVSPVIWDDDELTFAIDGTRIGVLNGWSNLEVIGNIYENPELLK